MNSTTTTKAPPLNQIIKCSFEEYQAAPGLNQSKLKDILQSPRHFYARHVLGEQEYRDSEAMRFGRVVHSALLEPEHFKRNHVLEPVCDKRTKEGKAVHADYLKSLKPDTISCKADDLVAIERMHESWIRHEPAQWLLSEGQAEASIWWREPVHGILCKARLDYISTTLDDYTVVDLKTTEDARENFFRKQIVNYQYHFQAAWYAKAIEEGLGKPVNKVVFIALEKSAPYEMQLYAASNSLLNAGKVLANTALELHASCNAADSWPGYSDEIREIHLTPQGE